MDLNGDGVNDIAGGSYLGQIIMYPGIKEGSYAPSVEMVQATDLKSKKDYDEYIFTNPHFADFNGDGLFDAIIGGSKGIRVMLNEGTATNPKLGVREEVLNVDGKQVRTYSSNADVECQFLDNKTFIAFVDWDNDGVNDIISTNSYHDYGQEAILFHKGVQTKEGLRFYNPISLIKNSDKEKLLPGSDFVPYVTDFNNDGVLDILIGSIFKYIKEDNSVYYDGVYTFDNSKEQIKMRLELNSMVAEMQAKNGTDKELIATYQAKSKTYTETRHAEYERDELVAKGHIIVLLGKK